MVLYHERFPDQGEVYPGILAFLAALQAEGSHSTR